MKKSLMYSFFLVLAIFNTALFSQDYQIHYELTGEKEEPTGFGESLNGGWDIDNDGYEDFIIGASSYPNHKERRGKVYVYSGKEGKLISTLEGADKWDDFGYSVSMGNINNDEHADIIIGSRERIDIFSGKTFEKMREKLTKGLGTWPMDTNDLDQDGFTDICFYDGKGKVSIYSGKNGLIIFQIADPVQPNERLNFFHSVSTNGDFDNDGFPDIAIGASDEALEHKAHGKVFVYSGVNGELIKEFTGDPSDGFGFYVQFIGDIDNDNYQELFIRNAWRGIYAKGYLFSGADHISTCFGFPGYTREYDLIKPLGNIMKDDTYYTVAAGESEELFGGKIHVMTCKKSREIYKGDKAFALATTDIDADGNKEIISGYPASYTKDGKRSGNVLVFKDFSSPKKLYGYSRSNKQWELLDDSLKNFDPKHPTIVLIHGRNADKNKDFFQDWIIDIAMNINERVKQSKINILAWNWMNEAYAPLKDIGGPLSKVNNQGVHLAVKLNELFTTVNYPREQAVHLIGHSYGAFLATVTGLILARNNWHVPRQITLLDIADLAKYAGVSVATKSLDGAIFELRSQYGIFFDLYHGITSEGDHGVNVWVNVPPTNLRPDVQHSVYEWYKETINDALDPQLFMSKTWGTREKIDGTLGFDLSPFFVQNHPVSGCRAAELETQMFVRPHYKRGFIWESSDYLLVKEKCKRYVPPINNGVTSFAGVSLVGSGKVAAISDTHISITTGSPMKAVLLVVIDPTWDYFTFEYKFLSALPESTLKISMYHPQSKRMVDVFEMTSAAAHALGWLQTGLFDVTSLHSENVRIEFEPQSQSSGTTVEIKNLTFWTDAGHFNAPPVAHAGENKAIHADSSGSNIFSLDAGQTTDPDDSDLIYWWMLDGLFLTEGKTPEITLEQGAYTIELMVRDQFDHMSKDVIIIEIEDLFIRGDANGDKRVDISDSISILNRLFVDQRPFDCRDAADVNDDSGIDISDAIRVLNFLFLNASPPPKPYPQEGLDPTPDLQGCKK